MQAQNEVEGNQRTFENIVACETECILRTLEKTVNYLGLMAVPIRLFLICTADRKVMEGFLPGASGQLGFSGGWLKKTGGALLYKLMGINTYIMNTPLPMVTSQEVFRKFLWIVNHLRLSLKKSIVSMELWYF
ncbi:hypothetical protein [Coxiella endosymbiont of Ornithodoros maritimus]|uniref:hypothetical protein n=1 Tax=Coxiella endosymbiont of Ornithodoros maritimus TaxID=1656172 RepID=UPI002263CE9B|nr:hypothetical protein [Coxiella endosymbiont of Ornithodoros maritimus]